MEAKLHERLRAISNFRRNFINGLNDGLCSCLPSTVIEHSCVFHGIIIFTSFILIFSTFATTHRLTLISLHPTCMVIGGLVFIGEGIVAYRNNVLLDTLSPIMQHTKRTKVRSIHQTMQIIGTSFIIFGFLIVIASKTENGRSAVPSSIHAILGTITILFIVIQMFAGLEKLNNLEPNNKRVHKWHGDAGQILWDLICLSILTVHIQMKKKQAFSNNSQRLSLTNMSDNFNDEESNLIKDRDSQHNLPFPSENVLNGTSFIPSDHENED
eukprot:gene7103-9692_t